MTPRMPCARWWPRPQNPLNSVQSEVKTVGPRVNCPRTACLPRYNPRPSWRKGPKESQGPPKACLHCSQKCRRWGCGLDANQARADGGGLAECSCQPSPVPGSLSLPVSERRWASTFLGSWNDLGALASPGLSARLGPKRPLASQDGQD